MVGQRTCEYETVKGDDRVAEGHESRRENCLKTACSKTSNNSSIEFDCSLQQTATGNGNLQPEIEINEYLSSKKLLE